MARINFEDDVEAQNEFWRLLPFVGGNRVMALGKLILFFRIAQKAYGRRVPMTEQELRSQDLGDMIDSGWAIPTDGGFYALGSKKHFGWYRQKVDAGKLGGRPKESEEVISANREEPIGGTPVPAANPLALAPSLALSKKEKNINTGAIAPVPNLPLPTPKKSKFSDETKNKMRAFIATYASGYREKYGAPPEGIRDRALVGKLGYWIESVSEERACQLAQVYLQIDHKWVNDSCHDLWQFFRHLNRIGNALATGQDPGGIDWKKVFGAA